MLLARHYTSTSASTLHSWDRDALGRQVAGDGDDDDDEPDPFECPPQYRAWITAHGADAIAAGLPEANVLALTSIESGWGNGRFARDGNDFFNLEACWAYRTPLPASGLRFKRAGCKPRALATFVVAGCTMRLLRRIKAP